MSSFSAGGGGLSPSGYTDVTASREEGTVYQNTTGGPIEVCLIVETNPDGQGEAKAQINVNGNDRYARTIIDLTGDYVDEQTLIESTAFIPDGQTYELDTDISGSIARVYIQEW